MFSGLIDARISPARPRLFAAEKRAAARCGRFAEGGGHEFSRAIRGVMMAAGLTGGLAAGKSAAATHFAALGAAVIDADVVGRELTASGGRAIAPLRAALGGWAFAADGAFDRDVVRARAFADSQTRRRLENVLHPLIEEEMRRQMRVAAGPYILLVIPLLLETGAFAADCRRIVVVDCAPETQIARAVGRGMDAAEARAIVAAQMPRAERIARADDIIDNEGARAALADAVRMRHREFVRLSERNSDA